MTRNIEGLPYLKKLDTRADVRKAIVGLLSDYISGRQDADGSRLIYDTVLKQGLYAMQLVIATFNRPGAKPSKGE